MGFTDSLTGELNRKQDVFTVTRQHVLTKPGNVCLNAMNLFSMQTIYYKWWSVVQGSYSRPLFLRYHDQKYKAWMKIEKLSTFSCLLLHSFIFTY